MTATITPLLLARLAGIPGAVARYGRARPDEMLTVPLFCYLVEPDDGPPILFDLGSYDQAEAQRRNKGDVLDHRSPADAVTSAGRDPADIHTVVVSHLHWDHSVGIRDFPNARMAVQRDELRYAFAPNPEHWRPYDSWEGGQDALWREDLDRIDPVDGHLRLGRDVMLVPTPGHTPGSQSLLVRSDRSYLLCGDLFMGYDNMPGVTLGDRRIPFRVPPGIHTDLPAWRASVDRIELEGWVPLPAHEPRVTAVLEEGLTPAEALGQPC